MKCRWSTIGVVVDGCRARHPAVDRRRPGRGAGRDAQNWPSSRPRAQSYCLCLSDENSCTEVQNVHAHSPAMDDAHGQLWANDLPAEARNEESGPPSLLPPSLLRSYGGQVGATADNLRVNRERSLVEAAGVEQKIGKPFANSNLRVAAAEIRTPTCTPIVGSSIGGTLVRLRASRRAPHVDS